MVKCTDLETGPGCNGGPKRGMYTLYHSYIFRNVSIFAIAQKFKFRLCTPCDISPIYVFFLVHPLHSGSKFYFSVLGIFYIGLFLTSFFVPLMVNRYCFVEKLSFSALLYHILFKVWAPRRFYYWNLSGNLVGRALWHNHLCLPADPIPGLRLPRSVHARLQHGHPLVLHPGNPPGKPPHTPCSCLRPHRHHVWTRLQSRPCVRLLFVRLLWVSPPLLHLWSRHLLNRNALPASDQPTDQGC